MTRYTPDPVPGACIIMGSSLNVNRHILDQKFTQYQDLVDNERIKLLCEYTLMLHYANSSPQETRAFGINLDPCDMKSSYVDSFLGI